MNLELEMDVTPLVQGLQAAGEDVKRACALAVAEHAERAASRIAGEYPVGPTGNLRARVYTRKGHARGSYSSDVEGTAYTVFSRAPHAWIYNHGTDERFDNTRQNAKRGRMPANPVLPRVMSDVRRELYQAAQRIVDEDRRN